MPAVLHDIPVCFECHTRIEHSPVFAAICGDVDCPSVVFHGLCLMEFREKQARAEAEGITSVLTMVRFQHSPGCPNV